MITARRSSAPESALDFVPGEMNDRRAAVDVVRGKLRVAERREQRAHLALRELLARLDRRLARDSRREPLVSRRRAGDAIPRQRIERLAQTALGVEPRMRHRNGVDDQRVSAESFDFESELLEVFAIGIERFSLGWAKVKRQRKKEVLRRSSSTFESANEFLIENALVRRVLVDEDQPVGMLECDVRVAQLKKWRDRLGDRRLARRGSPCKFRAAPFESGS